MALLGPRLDSGPGLAAGTARHNPHAAAIGPVLGHRHRVHTRRLGLHHVLGGDRRQPVCRRQRTGNGRALARHLVAPVDRAHRSNAVVLRHGSVRHGRHRHRAYNVIYSRVLTAILFCHATILLLLLK